MKILLLFLLSAALACADPIPLKNTEASELLTALLQVGPGLTAQNTTKMARNIITLRPIVEAWQKGNQAATEKYKITVNTKTDSPEGTAFMAEVKKNNEDVIMVDLQRLIISEEEISAAKLSPPILSVVWLYLEPKPKNPAVTVDITVEAAKK